MNLSGDFRFCIRDFDLDFESIEKNIGIHPTEFVIRGQKIRAHMQSSLERHSFSDEFKTKIEH